jgi:hypothetical protein
VRDEPGDRLVVTKDQPLHLPLQDVRVVLHDTEHCLKAITNVRKQAQIASVKRIRIPIRVKQQLFEKPRN